MEFFSSYFFANFFGGIFYGLTLADFAIPLLLLLWSPILFIRLPGVDFREISTGLVYGAYCVLSGLVVVILCPMEFHRISDQGVWVGWAVLFFALGTGRWIRRAILQKKRSRNGAGKTKSESEPKPAG